MLVVDGRLLISEDQLLEMIRNIRFKDNHNPFQRQLSKDIANIKQSDQLLVLADKTTNFYKVTPDKYKELLHDNITKDYQKTTDTIAKNITTQDKKNSSTT